MKALLCCAAVVSFFFVLIPSVQAVTVTPAVESGSSHVAICGSKAKGHARCHAEIIVDTNGKPHVTAVPSGYGPAQFRGAYHVDGIVSSATTIAIVDAYDNPNALSDLNTYSDVFGLAHLSACSVSSGTTRRPCFEKIDQKGGTKYPSKNSGWAMEIALDVQVAHAMCENCNILLVEASSSSMTSLLSGFDTAVRKGAKIISSSWGGAELSTEKSYDKHFNVPGVFMAFSSGDNGYGVNYPASSQYVTAVGGTTLHLSGNTAYKSESAWSGTGSGCSAYEAKPSWQHDPNCANRTVADVAADADPHTGAAVYSSNTFEGKKGWFILGGTSLASPIVAGIVANGGKLPASAVISSLFYKSSANLTDVSGGGNGSCPSPYLCKGVAGYDGPTGLGSPKGPRAL